MPLQQIITQQTRLIALSQYELESYLNSPEKLAEKLCCQLSSKIKTAVVDRAIRIKIEKMSKAPFSAHPWYTYWLTLITHNNFGAGLIGFKGVSAGYKQVEIGYGIDPDYRNKGYTTESAQALIQWAFQDERCKSVVACDVLNDNLASIRVLDKLGFEIYERNPNTSSYIIHKKESKRV